MSLGKCYDVYSIYQQFSKLLFAEFDYKMISYTSLKKWILSGKAGF